MNFLIFLLYLGIFCITGGIIFRKAVEKMKDSQIRVCGRAAQTDSGAGGAVMFGCLAAAAVAGGFMTAGARLLLNASAVTSALSSVSRLLSPALNAATCLLLTLAVAALITPPGQGMKRYYLLCALGKSAGRQSASRHFAAGGLSERSDCALPWRRSISPCEFFPPAGRGACGGRDIYAFLVLRRRCDNGGGVRWERAHARYGLYILLGHAAVSCGGGIYIGCRAGYPRKTGSEKKP